MKGTHLPDEHLVGLLDRELDSVQARGARRHIQACAECRHRFLELEHSSAAVDAVLDACPVGPSSWRPRSRRRSRRADWLGAAIAATLVILLLVPGVRAGILAEIQRLRNFVVGEPPGAIATPTQTPGAESGTSLRFPIRDNTLTIELRSHQQAGRIEVVRTAGDLAEASIMNTGSADFAVLPGRLVIENDPASTTHFRVHVTARVQRVIVLVAGVEHGRLEGTSERLLLSLRQQR